MTDDGVTTYLQWRDKKGTDWNLRRVEYRTMVSWHGASIGRAGSCVAHVKTHEMDQLLTIARLMDVNVDRHMQRCGIGSKLVNAVIAQCKRRGNSGLNGEIVRNDNDHPD